MGGNPPFKETPKWTPWDLFHPGCNRHLFQADMPFLGIGNPNQPKPSFGYSPPGWGKPGQPNLSGWWFSNIFWMFTPHVWGKSFPIWGLRMFLQMGWKKHQLVETNEVLSYIFHIHINLHLGLFIGSYGPCTWKDHRWCVVLRCHMLIGARSESEGGVRKVGGRFWAQKNRFIGKIFPPENEEKIWTILKGYMLVFGVGRTPLVGVVMPQIPQLILPLKIGQIGPKKEAGVQSSEPLLFRGFRHEFWREGNLDITLSLMAGWWFKYFVFLPLPGEMIQFDEHIFQMGWNHQPKNLLTTVQESYTHPRERVIACW